MMPTERTRSGGDKFPEPMNSLVGSNHVRQRTRPAIPPRANHRRAVYEAIGQKVVANVEKKKTLRLPLCRAMRTTAWPKVKSPGQLRPEIVSDADIRLPVKKLPPV